MQSAIGQQSRCWIGVVSASHVKRAMTESMNTRCLNLLCHSVEISAIADLLDQLTFTRGNRNWGYTFRYGHFEIAYEDFLTIAGLMLGNAGDMEHAPIFQI